MLSLGQLAFLALLAFAAIHSSQAASNSISCTNFFLNFETDINVFVEFLEDNLSHEELAELYNEMPEEYREHLFLPGISSTPSNYRPRKLKASLVGK